MNKLIKIICFQCTENMRKLKFKLVRNVIPLYGTSYTTCIGCDTTFNEMLNIKEDCIRQTRRANHNQNNTTNTSNSISTSSSTSQSQINQRQQPASNSTRSVSSNNEIVLNRTSNISGRSTQNHNSQPNSQNIVNRNTTMLNNTNGTRSIRNNNDADLIRTSGTSERSIQNSGSNASQPSRSRTVNRNTTISNNRNNFNSWDDNWDNFNTDDFNSSWNGSNRSASSNSQNAANKTSSWGNIDNDAEIMCNCHQIAIQLTVKKEGPNKGKKYQTEMHDLRYTISITIYNSRTPVL